MYYGDNDSLALGMTPDESSEETGILVALKILWNGVVVDRCHGRAGRIAQGIFSETSRQPAMSMGFEVTWPGRGVIRNGSPF